jgi:serine/threonine protein kinase
MTIMPSDAFKTDSEYAETIAGGGPQFSREQEDVALAALTLRSGALTERQLSESLGSWTIHGSVSFAEHLVTLGLLDESSRQRLSQEAAAFLATYDALLAGGSGSASESVIVNTLESIDPSGKIARLMGIQAAAGKSAVESADNRRATLRYRLIRKIGQGGLGRVWLAFDENLKRHVAIKEISGRENPMTLERFRREAKITGQLEHPGIVPVYQLGDDDQTGQAFYAMRFLGKSTLHDTIMEYHERRASGDDNPMLIRQLLTDFVNVCQAIGHAHSRNVIHRDLKPENIAIDSFGQVIVIDWGIAKVIDDLHVGEAGADVDLDAMSNQSTLQGQVLGTPMYMAPEQASGRVDELDERTDIYGLGAILFAILTGIAPHEKTRETSEAAGGRDLLSAITSRPTPCAREVDSEIDDALSAICAKAMARKQYARYHSATALADDVQRWMAGEPVSAHKESASQRVRRWIRHHHVWSQIIAAALIVGVVALATLAIASRQSRIAARQVLFEELDAYDKEINVQLESTAVGLMQDARFMSTLPPIQGIIEARGGVEESEGEDVWRGRLETIYEGLLRANPSYLSISYTAVADEGTTNVVRVERRAGDTGYVRRVPTSRLGKLDDEELLTQTAVLSPGDILLVIRQQADSPNRTRQQVRLVASTPVFDEMTGEFFGIVAVESDLLTRIVQFLERVEQNTASIFITDLSGRIWVTDNPDIGVDIKNHEMNIENIIPGAAGFLTAADQHRRFMQSEGWIANRMTLDPANPQATVGVFLQLWQ